MQLVCSFTCSAVHDALFIQRIYPHPAGCMNNVMWIPYHTHMRDAPCLIMKEGKVSQPGIREHERLSLLRLLVSIPAKPDT